MKKILLIASLVASLSAWGQSMNNAQTMIPSQIDPWNLQRTFDMNLTRDLVPQGAVAPSMNGKLGRPHPQRAIQRADEAADTVSYFAVAQSYYQNYAFTYAGGDILTYNIGVAVDGTKVTFTNLFNMYDPNSWSVSVDYPIEGVYDANNKTITFKTSTNFENATVAGKIYDYYVGVLVSGTVSEDGKLSPADELVFNVEGDFERIYTNQSFGIAEYTPDGSSSYGQYKMYRSFSANLPKEGAKLLIFNNNIEFGQNYPNASMTKTLTVVNTGSSATDYVVELESDDDAFTCTNATGTIAGQSSMDLTFDFNCGVVGEKEGIAEIDYDDDDAQTLMVQLTGEIIPIPDYSAVVKSGDFTFNTNIDYPFFLDTLASGQVVASSGLRGAYGKSQLDVTMVVPEGKLGTFSFKGMSNNDSYWYQSAGGYFVDDMNTAAKSYTGQNEDMSQSIELAPGTHTVRFQYDGYYYTGLEANRLYVYDLELTTDDLPADAAVLLTPYLDMGNFVLQENGVVTGTAMIEIQNKGANDLTVTSAVSTGEEFTVDGYDGISAATLQTLSIPVTFTTSTAGEKTADIIIGTSAGSFEVEVLAHVIDMPDFSQIVTEGLEYMTFTTDNSYPFIVENGVAYNLSSGITDYQYTKSTMRVTINIPEGKMGYFAWDGMAYGADIDSVAWTHYSKDRAGVDMYKEAIKSYGQYNLFGNNCDASSAGTIGKDDYWKSFLVCQPGESYYEFMYIQCGDTITPYKDRLEISNLRLVVEDFVDYSAELLTNEVWFDSTYVGPNRYTTATVTLHNKGNKALKVTDFSNSAPFYGIVPTDSANFDKDLTVTLWFYPTEEGEFNDSLTIVTNAGDFKVACHGATKPAEGLLLIGDFEDAAYGWMVYDGNNDGESWDLGSNLWGDYPDYCHSGHDCLASVSYSNYLGSITPDNWTMSPSFTIPDEGATLTYYIAAFHPERYAEHYALYVTEDINDVNEIAKLEPAYEETLTSDLGGMKTWGLRTVDLTPYAGKTVYLVYRHYDCTGQYIIRLDDVFVRINSSDGINDVISDGAHITHSEIYDLMGRKLNAMQDGVNIVRYHYDNGQVKSVKIMK